MFVVVRFYAQRETRVFGVTCSGFYGSFGFKALMGIVFRVSWVIRCLGFYGFRDQDEGCLMCAMSSRDCLIHDHDCLTCDRDCLVYGCDCVMCGMITPGERRGRGRPRGSRPRAVARLSCVCTMCGRDCLTWRRARSRAVSGVSASRSRSISLLESQLSHKTVNLLLNITN